MSWTPSPPASWAAARAAGGVGTVPGVFFGVIIFNVINYGLTFIGLSSYWQFVVKGVIIIGAIAVDVRKYNNKH